MTVKPASSAQARQAYTLVEVLIAGVLVTVMMVAVWSLLRTWSNMYDKGQTRTQLAQLTRSLSDQLTEDIQSVVVPTRSSRGRSRSGVSPQVTPTQDLADDSRGDLGDEVDPLATESETSSFEVREVALVGGKDWLVLDVVRTPNPWHQSDVESETKTPMDVGPQVYVPDLQRVIYTFIGVDDSQDLFGEGDVGELLDAGETTPGLLRLAMAREFVSELEGQDEFGGALSRGTSLRTSIFEFRDQILMGESYDLSSAITEEESAAAEAFVIPEPDESHDNRDGIQGVLEQDFVPEARWLEFRYFNGSSWSDSWDSSSGKGLPVAVEIRFELEEIEPVEDEEVSEEGLPTLEDEALPLEDDLMTESFEEEEPLWTDDALLDETQTEETPYHRVIVVLGLSQPPKAASSMDLMGDMLP